MTITYNLSQDDYLNHQLFIASLNERVKSQRQRSRIIWSLALLSLALVFYQKDESFLTYYFLSFGLFYAVFYPNYSRWYYKRHYKRHVNDVYKNRFDKVSNVIIAKEQIHRADETGETKISISQVDTIYETSDYFFIKLKSGMTLIILKLKIDDINLLKKELKQIAKDQQIDFIEMQNWKWT